MTGVVDDHKLVGPVMRPDMCRDGTIERVLRLFDFRIQMYLRAVVKSEPSKYSFEVIDLSLVSKYS